MFGDITTGQIVRVDAPGDGIVAESAFEVPDKDDIVGKRD